MSIPRPDRVSRARPAAAPGVVEPTNPAPVPRTIRTIRTDRALRSGILRQAAENSRVRDLFVIRRRKAREGEPGDLNRTSPRNPPRVLRTIRTDPALRSEILREAAEKSRVRDLVVLRARREASASPSVERGP